MVFSVAGIYRKSGALREEEHAVETMKEAVRAIRNVRTSMNVPPSKKAKVYVVSENEELLQIFEHSKVFFATSRLCKRGIFTEG